MTGILPTGANGGLVVRDEFGVCTIPATVVNAYCPQPEFTTSCEVSYLPDGCTARITPAQINAFESELLCFAEKLNPDGNWNCTDLCNLSTNFQSWLRNDYEGSFLDALEDHSCARPAITSAEYAAFPNAAFLMCDGEGNMVRYRPAPEPSVEAGSGIRVDTAIAPDGHTVYTVENLCCPTALDYDETNGNLTLTYGDGDTLVTGIPLETVTTLNYDAGTQQYTYTSEDGTETIFAAASGTETITTLIDNGDGTYSYTSEDGTVTTFAIPAATFSRITGVLPAAGNNPIATHTSGDGTVTIIRENVTSLVFDAANKRFVFLNEVGTQTNIPVPDPSRVTGVLPAAGNNPIATHTSGDGTVVVIRENVTSLAYDAATRRYLFTNEVGTVTPIAYSTTTVAGVIEIAPGAELNTKGCCSTDNTRAVTPAGVCQIRNYSSYDLTDNGVDHVGVVQQADGCKYRLKAGVGYYEHSATDIMSQFFNVDFAGVNEQIYTPFILPFPCSNADALRCQMTDGVFNSNNIPFSNQEARYTFSMASQRNTATTISLGYRLIDGGGPNPTGVMVFIPNART